MRLHEQSAIPSTLQKMRYLVCYFNNFGRFYSLDVNLTKFITQGTRRRELNLYGSLRLQVKQLILTRRKLLSCFDIRNVRRVPVGPRVSLQSLYFDMRLSKPSIQVYFKDTAVRSLEIMAATFTTSNSTELSNMSDFTSSSRTTLTETTSYCTLFRFMTTITTLGRVRNYGAATYNYLMYDGIPGDDFQISESSLEYLRTDISLALRCDFKTQLMYGLCVFLDFHKVHNAMIANNLYSGRNDYFSLNTDELREQPEVSSELYPFDSMLSERLSVRRIELRPGLMTALRALRHDFVITKELKFAYQ